MKNKIFFLAFLLLSASLMYSQEFTIDKGHTFVNFSVNRFGAVDVHARFNEYSGTIQFDEAQHMITSAEFTIEVESIDSGHEIRDGHLKGEIWLNASKYPKIIFKSSSIKSTEEGFLATGLLSIKGVTKTISLPFQMTGPAIDPTKQNTIGISASININRQDYGINFSKLMDNGKLFIGNDVRIHISALAQQSTK